MALGPTLEGRYYEDNHISLKVLKCITIILRDGLNSLPAYISIPCTCCGSKKHGLISIIEDQGKEIISYTCPLVEENNSEGAQSQILQGYLRYRPSPTKMVMTHDHDTETLKEALEKFEYEGDGGSLTRSAMEMYRKEVNEAHKWTTWNKTHTDNDSLTTYPIILRSRWCSRGL